VRVNLAVLFLVVLLTSSCSVLAQSPNGSISGIVFDPDAKSVPGAEVIVLNDLTGVKYVTSTNDQGVYAVPNLPPGSYRIQVSKFGFKAIIKPDITLNVQDALSLNFTLPIGAASVVVTVEGGAPIVNTQDASVSSVVDRSYVQNIPLNGRSFQDLILLTPGVVTSSPQAGATIGTTGEFSVNGQRTQSNYYTVDGVSGNVGIVPGIASAPATSGSLPVSSTLGTTQGLVSVDALSEFRVRSSTYSAQYGRNPGGQFSFATRAGTNEWHGSAFDYIRNNVFDANDWFNDENGLRKPALRQNDFGGTLGGPVVIPHAYKGQSRTFFFFSYEGLRLDQPKEATVSYVPTPRLRQSSPSALQPVLNAFPMPHCPTSGATCAEDLGNGLGDFVSTWSNPGAIDAYSVRLDHNITDKHRLFVRISDTSSNELARNPLNPNVESSFSFTTTTYTAGLSSQITRRLNNEFHLNYSLNTASIASRIGDFAGAAQIDLAGLQGLNVSSNPAYQVEALLAFPGFTSLLTQSRQSGEQQQWNVVDSLSMVLGRHQLVWGVDQRMLNPTAHAPNPLVLYDFFGEGSVGSGQADFVLARSQAPAYPTYRNFSAFVQDEWKVSPRLNVSLGVRWEVNPAPGSRNGQAPYTTQGTSLSTISLAPQGTSLWQTTWFNFAPRLGLAYVLRNASGWETVLRAGGGVFFDTGQQVGSAGYFGPGFVTNKALFSAAFPLAFAALPGTPVNPPVPPYGTVFSFPAHLQLPYTLEWNVSLEQALGRAQALTVSYVASHAARLLEESEFGGSALANPNISTLISYQNGLSSDYSSLQLQFQRRLSSGLTALASYTWSHCIDYGSQDNSLPYIRANCDFDVRHNFSSALSFDLPNMERHRTARTLFSHWGADGRFTARTSFPVTFNGLMLTDTATGQIKYAGLDVVPGQPLYVFGATYPGGREINPAAFALPPGCTVFFCGNGAAAGNSPRNSLRGFGAWQMDLAVRRDFPIYERLTLQFRAEAFNIFNHPNFGAINVNYCAPGPGCTFGQATASLAQSLGVLSPLYQTGGPRSLQFALKLLF
jgi:Carboxypeptidase regulatory-like domain/TonB dependent receptor